MKWVAASWMKIRGVWVEFVVCVCRCYGMPLCVSEGRIRARGLRVYKEEEAGDYMVCGRGCSYAKLTFKAKK